MTDTRSVRVEFRGGLVGRLAKFPGSNRWAITYWWEGRERRESTGTTDFDVAKKKLKARLEHLQAAKRGSEPFVSLASKRITVSELLDALEKDFRLRKIKGLVETGSHLRIVREAFGARRALSLTAEAADQVIEQWRADGKKDATINRRIQLLGQAFKLAHQRKVVPVVPQFRRLRENNARKGFVTPLQFAGLVAHLPEALADAARVAYLIGWRKSEVVGLSADNVDLRAGELRIGDSKSGEGRVVPLRDDEGNLNALGEVIERRLAARRVGAKVVRDLFHVDGGPLKADFRKAWARACRAAGLVRPKLDPHGQPVLDKRGQAVVVPALLFHDLRRTFAKDAIAAGNDPKTVMDVAGWKTVATFHRYQIVDQRQMARALGRLELARKISAETRQ
jgi:integrase